MKLGGRRVSMPVFEFEVRVFELSGQGPTNMQKDVPRRKTV